MNTQVPEVGSRVRVTRGLYAGFVGQVAERVRRGETVRWLKLRRPGSAINVVVQPQDTARVKTQPTCHLYAQLQMARAHMTRKAGSAPWPTPRVIAVPSGFKPQATVFRYCAHADGMFAAYRIAWS